MLVSGSPTKEFPLEMGCGRAILFPFSFYVSKQRIACDDEFDASPTCSSGIELVIMILCLFLIYNLLMTHFFGSKSWTNVRALHAVLNLFEEMSGLKVNFHKSLLVGVNINDSWLNEAALVLNFKIGKLPFVYLGMSIRGNLKHVLFW